MILDSKRGDIARSSLNYAQEAFDAWACDAVTVAPYMGSDSVKPFTDFEDKGVYILNRTSNPGEGTCRTCCFLTKDRCISRLLPKLPPTMTGVDASEPLWELPILMS